MIDNDMTPESIGEEQDYSPQMPGPVDELEPSEPAYPEARCSFMDEHATGLGAAVARIAEVGPVGFTLRLEQGGSRARLDAARPRGPVRRLVRALGRRFFEPLHVSGVLDVAGRRVLACDQRGTWGMVQIADRVWSGRAGRSVQNIAGAPAPLKVDPLGLLDTVSELAAPGHGSGPGARSHIVARADGSSVEVALDAGVVTRVRVDDDGDVSTLTVLGAVTDVDALDWTRLPSTGLP